jgi:hypothetical protein
VSDSRPLGFWLKLVDRLLDDRFAAVLEEHGVSRGQWRLLNVVSGDGATAEQVELAVAPFQTEDGMAVSDQLSELMESDWVVLAGAEYRLTERGASAHARLAEVVTELRTDSTDGISSDEYERTVRTLERMARNLGWSEQ